MRKLCIVLILLLINHHIFSCVCNWFDSDESKKELFNNSDLVIVGHPIMNIDSLSYDSRHPDQVGFTILFKVDSLLKGILNSDTIFINQYAEGNCAQYFYYQNTYLVFGNRIESYDTLEVNSKFNFDDYDYERKVLKLYDGYGLCSSFHELTNKYCTIQTNQCITFISTDDILEFFELKFLKSDVDRVVKQEQLKIKETDKIEIKNKHTDIVIYSNALTINLSYKDIRKAYSKNPKINAIYQRAQEFVQSKFKSADSISFDEINTDLEYLIFTFVLPKGRISGLKNYRADINKYFCDIFSRENNSEKEVLYYFYDLSKKDIYAYSTVICSLRKNPFR